MKRTSLKFHINKCLYESYIYWNNYFCHNFFVIIMVCQSKYQESCKKCKKFSKEEKQIYYVELFNILNAIFMNSLVIEDGTPIDIALCCFGLKNDY